MTSGVTLYLDSTPRENGQCDRNIQRVRIIKDAYCIPLSKTNDLH